MCLVSDGLGYDAASNALSITTTLPAVGSDPAGTDYQSFCYDEQNRLVWASTTGTPSGPAGGSCGPTPPAGTLSGSGYTQTFAYDVLGRMTTGPQAGYTYGDAAHVHAVTSTSGGSGFSYDAAGNATCVSQSSSTGCSTTPQTGAQLGYDAEGRLISWQNAPNNPTTTDGFAYDGAGQRVEQQEVQSGSTTTWVYVGGLAIYRITSGGTSLYKYYAFAGHLVAGRQATLHDFLTDQVGSVQVQTDTSGNAQNVGLRQPTGSTRYGTSSFLYQGFTSQLKDDVTNLVYFNARYYDQDAGVFVSVDPVLDGLNRYQYVGGNPETWVDPSGYSEITLGFAGAGSYGPLLVGAGVAVALAAGAVALRQVSLPSYPDVVVPGASGAGADPSTSVVGNGWTERIVIEASGALMVTHTGSDKTQSVFEVDPGTGGHVNPAYVSYIERFDAGYAANDPAVNSRILLAASAASQDDSGSKVKTTTEDLYAFGGSPTGGNPGPRPSRPGTDLQVDSNGMITESNLPQPGRGASTFIDPQASGLNGHYYRLPAGTPLPPELDVYADGSDVPGGTEPWGHRTIFPSDLPMSLDGFNGLYRGLPWEYGGRIR